MSAFWTYVSVRSSERLLHVCKVFMKCDSDWQESGIWNVEVKVDDYEDGAVEKLAKWFSDQGCSYVASSPKPGVIRFDVKRTSSL